jgi:hypothetical protein
VAGVITGTEAISGTWPRATHQNYDFKKEPLPMFNDLALKTENDTLALSGNHR